MKENTRRSRLIELVFRDHIKNHKTKSETFASRK